MNGAIQFILLSPVPKIILPNFQVLLRRNFYWRHYAHVIVQSIKCLSRRFLLDA